MKAKFPGHKWTPQASGQSIPEAVALQLEKLWQIHLPPEKPQMPLWEGAMYRVMSNQRERRPVARQQCIEHFGLNCAVCGFNFKNAYGVVGKDVIHVHHLEPLGLTNQKRIVDPIRDLRPVCANCHLIIHKRDIPFSIEEVKEMLETAKG